MHIFSIELVKFASAILTVEHSDFLQVPLYRDQQGSSFA